LGTLALLLRIILPIYVSKCFMFSLYYFLSKSSFKLALSDGFTGIYFCAATKCHGNRQDQFPPGNLFVSVSEDLWDNGAACGRRYRLRCLSATNRPCKDGTIDVRVVDFCRKSPCPSTILLPGDAFSAVSHSPSAKINVEYNQYAASPVLLYL